MKKGAEAFACWVVFFLCVSVAFGANEPRKYRTEDKNGVFGTVLFDHAKHEAAINPDPNFPHAANGIACLGCHHTVKVVTARDQYVPCMNCHKMEGDPDNPVDKEGYELNNREINHRACIGCHVAAKVRTSNEYFQNVTFTKCKECHIRENAPVQMAQDEPPPPPMQMSPAASHGVQAAVRYPVNPPLGYAGTPNIYEGQSASADFIPRPDRWRIGFPDDKWYKHGSGLDPYGQNTLKGDYPVIGNHTFINLTLEQNTFVTQKRLPVPSDVSTLDPDSAEFFGRGNIFFTAPEFIAQIDLFHGDSAYKPIDWRILVQTVFNLNYIKTQENGIVNIDVRRGPTRTDHYLAIEQGFGEIRLGDTPKIFPFLKGGSSSPFFDTTSVRVGIQPFVSDFRGLIFRDSNLGGRLFGNAGNNRYQYNVAGFYQLEKDTNSDLNTRDFRDQVVVVANWFRQDTFKPGYTMELSYHYNYDKPSTHYDENAFLVRPAPIGDVAEHAIRAHYIGWAGDGHLGILNIDHAFYQVFGTDSFNPLAGRPIDLNAQLAVAELSIDKDWKRYRASVFWASGDKDPLDDKGKGFDAILDQPAFAGGQFSFWNNEGIRLIGTGVGLVQPGSLLPTLRSSKTEGQANFVNPGVLILNGGFDADLTQKWKLVLNVNYLRFNHTEPLEQLLFQDNIDKNIGIDYGGGFIWRPKLSENIIVSAGASSLIPGKGFKEIYSSNCSDQGCGAKSKILYSTFANVKFTY
ncbi:MAG: hypothetical protein C5B54_03720 [Acidobacteria bacterium]|nr:MAG: hypothetical protein C5B54_03720 [Acidobacteriota bacterium]